MKPRSQPLPRLRCQRGAIALTFSLTLGVLLAAGGLVIDLGHLYVLKSELQNGADSAALAGAKEINMTAAGVLLAANKAIAFAQKNKFNFSTDLTLDHTNIEFGPSPNGPWFSVADTQLHPGGRTFIRVKTDVTDVPSYLMRAAPVRQFLSVSTYGEAVAGRFVVDITPLGLCAIDPVNRLNARETPALQKELLEYGFRRGMTYDMLRMGPIGGPSDPMLLNPVDSPPTACQPSHSSANFTAPFVCQGNSAVANNATEVYANTGVSAGPVEKALNSRFNQYPGGTACVPATAPPDRNVRDYPFGDTTNGPARYMEPDQSDQTHPSGLPVAAPLATTAGVLWTYSRPLKATGTVGNYAAGDPFDVADWSDLYNGGLSAAAYPESSPYAQTSGPYFQAPTTNTGASNRRLMNLAIVDCSAVTSNAMSCKRLTIVGVGRFFLQRPVSMSGAGAGLYVEFAGLIAPVPNSEIKLYR